MESRRNSLPQRSILVVEDENDCRAILATIISRRFPDFAVWSAADGIKGLELFKERTPDIVITDINMPGMGGIPMGMKIREFKPDTKLIVLTAGNGNDVLEDSFGAKLEIEHYILKPVDFGRLFTVIEQCISEI